MISPPVVVYIIRNETTIIKRKVGYMMQPLLAQKLRVIRAQQGLTVVQAAEKIGIDRHTLRDLELGRRRPNFETMEKVAKGYGVSVGDLVEEGEPVASPLAEAPPPPPEKAGSAGLEEQRRLFGLCGLILFELNARWIKWLEDLPEPPNAQELERGRQVIKDEMFPTISAIWTGLENYHVFTDLDVIIEKERRGVRVPRAFEEEFERLYEELSTVITYVIPKARNWYTRLEERAEMRDQLESQAKIWERQWSRRVRERSPL